MECNGSNTRATSKDNDRTNNEGVGVYSLRAIEHLCSTDFEIMWGDIRVNRKYELILINPSKAMHHSDSNLKVGYYVFRVKANDDMRELGIKEGEVFKMHFPITSFGSKLLRMIRYEGWLKEEVILSFKKLSNKTNEFKITKKE